jgi:hypothetical protein
MFTIKLLKLIKLFLFILLLNTFTGCGSLLPLTNHPPEISLLSANSDTIEADHNTIITCYATDQDGDQLIYNWATTGGSITGSDSMVAWTAPATAGTYTVTCTVRDGKGGEDSKSVMIEVSTWSQPHKPVVTMRDVSAVTYHLSSIIKAPFRIIQELEEEINSELVPDIVLNNNLERHKGGEIGYGVEFYWDNYPGASGYKIYRSINGEDYEVIFKGIDYCCLCWCYFFDTDIQEGNIYFYYITAYGGSWETMPSEVFVINTWLPSCSLVSPQNNEVINNPNPIFTWSPVGLTDFPYGSICYGDASLFVYDSTAKKTVWQRYFNDDLTVSSITYNDDGTATPLISGHTYVWWLEGYGYDENINFIAISYSDNLKFAYIAE